MLKVLRFYNQNLVRDAPERGLLDAPFLGLEPFFRRNSSFTETQQNTRNSLVTISKKKQLPSPKEGSPRGPKWASRGEGGNNPIQKTSFCIASYPWGTPGVSPAYPWTTRGCPEGIPRRTPLGILVPREGNAVGAALGSFFPFSYYEVDSICNRRKKIVSLLWSDHTCH